MKTWRLGLVGLALIVAAPAWAGWKDISVTATVPPQYPLTGVKRVAVFKFRGSTGRYSETVTNAFTAALFQAPQKSFDVVDRAEIDKLLQESQLAQSGVVDESSVPEVGKLLGADALIIGNIDDASTVKEERAVEKIKKYRAKTGEEYEAACPVVVRRANLGVSYKVVHVGTGKILAQNQQMYTIDQKNMKDPTPDDSWMPPKANLFAAALMHDPFAGSVELSSNEQLEQALATTAAQAFAKAIAPHQETLVIKWDTAIGDPGKAAFNMIQAGMVKDAQDMLEGKVPELEGSKGFDEGKRAALYHDCGVLREVGGDLSGALDWFKKALMVNPGKVDKETKAALTRVQERLDHEKKLQDQFVN